MLPVMALPEYATEDGLGTCKLCKQGSLYWRRYEGGDVFLVTKDGLLIIRAKTAHNPARFTMESVSDLD